MLPSHWTGFLQKTDEESININHQILRKRVLIRIYPYHYYTIFLWSRGSNKTQFPYFIKKLFMSLLKNLHLSTANQTDIQTVWHPVTRCVPTAADAGGSSSVIGNPFNNHRRIFIWQKRICVNVSPPSSFCWTREEVFYTLCRFQMSLQILKAWF